MITSSFEFSGSGTEYFKIWLTNLMLSILTLGIYSPWAKVRTKKYFYNNLSYQTHHFDYLASPIAILKGRIIAVIFFAVYMVVLNHFIINNILSVVLLITTPWIICRLIRFNARVSQFRNVRFNFSGKYFRAMLVFILFPFLALVSLGGLYPWLKKQQAHFKINHMYYGDIDFNTSVTSGGFYKIYLQAMAIYVVWMIGSTLIVALITYYLSSTGSMDDTENIIHLLKFSGISALIVAPFVWAFIKSQTTNIIYSSITIDKSHRLSASLKTFNVLKIYLGYGLLSILTLGLAFPWFKVAMAKYQIEQTQLILAHDLEYIIDNIKPAGSATGEELGEVFDVDIGIF